MNIINKELLCGKYTNKDKIIEYLRKHNVFDVKEFLDNTPEILRGIPLVGTASASSEHKSWLSEGKLDNNMLCHIMIPLIKKIYETTGLLTYQECLIITDRLHYQNIEGLKLLKEICPSYFEIFEEKVINKFKDITIPYITCEYKAYLTIPINNISFEELDAN